MKNKEEAIAVLKTTMIKNKKRNKLLGIWDEDELQPPTHYWLKKEKEEMCGMQIHGDWAY